MKTVILNGNPATGSIKFNQYLGRLVDVLNQVSQKTLMFNLAEMKIHYCVGCFNCWLATPGQCVYRDDMDRILTEVAEADRLIYASPLVMGFIHSSLKQVMDRTIPLILPYIGIYRGECHHYLRYEKSPLLGVLVEKEPDTDPEDLDIVNTSFQRLALNFRSRLLFTKTTESPVEEVAHEISHV
ncbi:MAG TPA: NAD(P)H-dependent oxidoreductase [Bacillota bacterium]|nr:NAD(P)H-dependent oxidoreductase [Bacillota bacterium]